MSNFCVVFTWQPDDPFPNEVLTVPGWEDGWGRERDGDTSEDEYEGEDRDGDNKEDEDSDQTL